MGDRHSNRSALEEISYTIPLCFQVVHFFWLRLGLYKCGALVGMGGPGGGTHRNCVFITD